MTNPFDLFERHSKKEFLSNVLLFKFEYFEAATNETINSLLSDIDVASKGLAKIEPTMPSVSEENYQEITEEQWSLIAEYSEYHSDIEFSKEYLNSLLEMRIVYLFKNLEIVMKNLIQIAYENTNTKDFYKWENMKAFFKTKSITISGIEGYNDCFDTKKVNNAIKHNDTLNEEIKNITEFASETEFNFENLDNFYKRVKPKVEIFCENLKIQIEKDLYSFDEERLTKIADKHFERMNNEDLKKLIDKLNSKLK